MESPAGLPNGNGRPPAPAAQEISLPAFLDHDADRDLEVRVVNRTLDLGSKLAASELRERTEKDLRHALDVMTVTKAGVAMTVVRGANHDWLEASLRQADVFERENLGDDGSIDLIDLPPEDGKPPPRRGA
jgi:hypothetical protein